MEHSVSRVNHHGYQLYHQICSYTSTGQLACNHIAGKQKVLNMIGPSIFSQLAFGLRGAFTVQVLFWCNNMELIVKII